MKNVLFPSCGCRPYPRPRPACPLPREERPCPPCPEAPEPLSSCCGGFLMQRIIAVGRLHRRRKCAALCLDGLPSQAQPPFTVVEVSLRALPSWEEMPRRCPQGLALLVQLPLQVRVRDGCGRTYTVSSAIEEELPLRFECPQNECWRGQPFVQAAVRLAGRACPCGGCQCDVPLEVLLEGYILAPCTLGRPSNGCPPSRPWYPQPIFDPYND